MKLSIFLPALFLSITSFSLNAQNEPATFEDLQKHFRSASLPYSLDSAGLMQIALGEKTANEQRLTPLPWKFYVFFPELEKSAQFSMMQVTPQPVAMFETDTSFIFLYNIARGLSVKQRTYSLSVFLHDGTYVKTQFIGGVVENWLTLATITAELNVEVTKYAFSANEKKGAYLAQAGKLKFNLFSCEGNPDQLPEEKPAAPQQYGGDGEKEK